MKYGYVLGGDRGCSQVDAYKRDLMHSGVILSREVSTGDQILEEVSLTQAFINTNS